MRLLSSSLVACTFVHVSTSLPVEEKPGFTPWPLEKRAPIPPEQFSNPSFGALFGVADDMCRGELKPGCWTPRETTVDTFLNNRKAGADDCDKPCLFYTSGLSGAAEREANWVLRAALGTAAAEGPRKYQTIWDLHDKKYYPFPGADKTFSETPQAKCMFLDAQEQDKDNHYDGCQRSYFRAMSKAMAMKCKGEVFVMTSTDLRGGKDVPVQGIWWDTEFPTLIDPKRPEGLKIEKITYLQVKEKWPIPEAEKGRAPPIEHQAVYWPMGGPGERQLKEAAKGGKKRATSSTDSESEVESSTNGTASAADQLSASIDSDFVKRASEDDAEILELGDEGYPYPYSIDDMVKIYGGIAW